MINQKPHELITNSDDICRILTTVEKKRSVISLRLIDNRNKFYSSIILEVNSTNNFFVIDAVNNIEINNRLLMGESFDILGFDNLPIVLSNNIAKRADLNQWPSAYQIPFPESIDYRQRRQAFRAEIFHSEATLINVIDTDKDLRGKIVDLSSTGVGVIFENTDSINDGDIFGHCHIRIPGNLEIYSSTVVKHPKFDRQTRLMHCGLEFLGLDPLVQKRIDRCVFHLQRQGRLYQQRNIG